jgi:hypothetical protein
MLNLFSLLIVNTAFILFQVEIAVTIIGAPFLPGSMENLFHITTTTRPKSLCNNVSFKQP